MASIILWPKAKSLWYTDEMVNSRIQSWEDMWNIAKEIGMNVNKWIAYSAPAPQAPAPQAPAPQAPAPQAPAPTYDEAFIKLLTPQEDPALRVAKRVWEWFNIIWNKLWKIIPTVAKWVNKVIDYTVEWQKKANEEQRLWKKYKKKVTPALIVADKQAAFIKYYVKNRQKKEPKYNERKFLEEFRPLADWTFVRRNAPETK